VGTAGFGRLLVVKLLREEKLVFACQAYVAAQLGKQFTEPAPWTLDDVFPETSAKTPVIFILSTGGHVCALSYPLALVCCSVCASTRFITLVASARSGRPAVNPLLLSSTPACKSSVGFPACPTYFTLHMATVCQQVQIAT
jgi:hypothetical protein